MGQYRMPISETMQRNIDSIINPDYDLKENFQNSGILISDRPKTGLLDLECVFHGKSSITGQDYNFTPYNVNKFIIKQHFADSYLDSISIDLKLTPLQLINILDNYRDLNCTIIMKQYDPKSDNVYHDKIVFDQTYKVVIKDKDIQKRISKKALIPDNKMDESIEHAGQMFDHVEFQLIKDDEYLLRKKKFNFIMRDVSVKDVILYMAKQCQVKKVCMTEPDNKKYYTNMIIPPQQTFESCIQFIQKYYGIYNKDISFYYTNEILYLYPIYETHPTTPDSAHFYYAGQDQATGVELYHAYSENNMIHVVITETPNIRDLADGGVEQFGNAILFQDSSRIVDLYSTIEEGSDNIYSRYGMGRLDLKEPNTSIFSLKDTDFGINKDAYNIRFKLTGNMYNEKSSNYSYMRSFVGIKWRNAWPDSFKPGYLIHYHYDGEDKRRRGSDSDEIQYSDSCEYMTRDGIVNNVVYTIAPASGAKSSNKQAYSCVADILLSLEYEPADPDNVSPINTSNVTSGLSALKNDITSLGSSVANFFTGAIDKQTKAVKKLFDL